MPAALLKKAALSIALDKKTLKRVLALILGIIVIVFTPLAVLLTMFNSMAESAEYVPVSAEVEAYLSLIEQYAEKHGIAEYTALIKAVMMQESGGKGTDPMQASESGYNTRYPKKPNGITDAEYSIDVGIQALAEVLEKAKAESPSDMDGIKLALQGYNFGPAYISWAKSYTKSNAAEYSEMMAKKYGWKSYGDKDYVSHILRYYPIGRSFSSGGIKIDTGNLQALVLANMSEGEKDKLRNVETVMNEIESKVIAKGLDRSRVREAQVLYILALYDVSDAENFTDSLVSCFTENQSDEQLIQEINSVFGKSIDSEDFTRLISGIRASYIYMPDFGDPGSKNNEDLVIWAQTALNEHWGYVWGTYGQLLSTGILDAKLEQYPDAVGGYYDFITENWLGKRTVDCAGLIKGYAWFDDETHELVYGSNSMPDIGADQMFESATEKGIISELPEIPGLAVWRKGHIGIYIGSGQIIEAHGTKSGVIQTDVSDGTFTHWLKIPYINYVDDESTDDNNSWQIA